MNERIESLYKEEIEKNIKELIEENGYVVNNCTVNLNLYNLEEEQGIKFIEVTISKEEEKSLIEKVEINLGLSKFLEESATNEEEFYNEELQNLKEEISSVYEIDQNKINIRFNN